MSKQQVKFNEEQFLDPRWRINNLYTIVDKKGQKVPFRPNGAQSYFLEEIHVRNLILKARQLGFTTLIAIVQLDDCLFTPNVRAAMIAHKLDDAKTIFSDKVKFAYDELDGGLKSAIMLNKDSADTLSFTNGSSMRVSTSTRSGTVQWLHVSEYGKICAQNPDKAREIKTGAFPSAEQGIITIESTAEGQAGDFFQKAQTAESLANRGVDLSPYDYKFFFFPWFRDPEYAMEEDLVSHDITPDYVKYFDKIEGETQEVLSKAQKHWYISQDIEYGGDMKREYPSTPKEAFEQAVEGAVFADQIARAEKSGRIGNFPVDPAIPVNTFWDLGRNDLNVIWLTQDQGGLTVFVGYYVNQGEWIGHYIQWLEDWAKENGCIYGEHYLPHDGDRKYIWNEGGTMDVMAGLNFFPEVVERTPNKMESINKARRQFSRFAFDVTQCKKGLDSLKLFRKKFNAQLDCWTNTMMHDDHSHTGDALLTLADSGHAPEIITAPRTRGKDYRNDGNRSSNRTYMSA